MIRCTEQYNTRCLKCGKIPERFIRIGAFAMCQECFEWEFGIISEFESKSVHGKIYCKWLKIYLEKYK